MSGGRRQPPVLPTVRFERTAIPEDDDSAPGGVEETKEDPDVRGVLNMIDQLTLDYKRIEQEVANLDAADDRNDAWNNDDEEDEVDVGVQCQQ